MPASDTVTLHLLVSGHVQGVYYRGSVVERARAAHLQGWVRNLGDGRVEATVRGPQPALDALLDWCRQGPAGARVDEVVVTAAGDTELPVPFETWPTA